MDRRSFLKNIGLGVIAAAISPKLLKSKENLYSNLDSRDVKLFTPDSDSDYVYFGDISCKWNACYTDFGRAHY